jgi:outer membrane protein
MKNFFVLTVALLFTSMASAADFKIGYVDVHSAVEKSTIGKKAKEEMKKEGEKKQKELDKKKADLDKMNEDIEKKKALLSEDALQKRGQELQMEVAKFRETVQKAQVELQKKENELLEPIVKRVKVVIEKIAKDKGFSMVIRSNQNEQIVVYSATEYDLTDDVVKALEKDK